jgi:hypothetical protein
VRSKSTREEMGNSHGQAVPCGEAVFEANAIRVWDAGPCFEHPTYPVALLLHELGHLVSWRRAGDAGEVAADAYLEEWWDPDVPLVWVLRRSEPW